LIFTLLSKIVSGAVVGYITNDLAIQMLFRKRFGLGGIVIRTKDEFITNISKLVEREIINHKTLQKEINNSPKLLANAIEQISVDFFEHQLFLVFPKDFAVGQIEDIDATYDALLSSFFGVPADRFSLTTSLDFIFTHTPVTSLLSDKQLTFTLDSLSSELHTLLNKPAFFHQSIQSAYKDLSDKTLEDIFPSPFSQKIAKNISNILKNLHEDLKNNFDEPISSNINEINELVQLNTLIQKISEQIVERKLHDIFGQDSTENLSDELNMRLLQIVNSEEGTKMITSFADFLVKVLENEKTTIFELLSDDLAQNFDNFLHAKLPIVLKSLIMWLEERKDKLELLIDATFKNNVKSRFQDLILRLFVGSISQYTSIVKKMTEIIEQHRQNPEETADKLTEQLINFLKGNTIGNIITQLKSNPTFLKKVDIGSLLIENINLALMPSTPTGLENNPFPKKEARIVKSPLFNLSSFFDRNLSDFVSAKEVEKFLQDTLQQLINNQLKNEYLYQEKFSKQLVEKLEEELLKNLTKKISQVLPLDTFDRLNDFLSKNLHEFLKNKQSGLVTFFREIIGKQLNHKTWADYVTPKQTEQWLPFIHEAIDNLLHTQFEKIKERKVGEFLKRFNDTDLNKQVPEFLQDTLIQNLPSLLKGKVEIAVGASMHKMDADKLRDLVEKFMGKELAPITIFGAFLGALAGAGLYALPSDNLLNLTNLAIASLAYGITGYSTNWLALKMIFRPYYQKFFPFTKIPVPFTPGVAAKNQARFAQNMGRFVVNGLLNKTHLTETFYKSKKILYDRIIAFFSTNHFEFLRTQVKKNTPNWSAKGGDILFEAIDKNQVVLNGQIGKQIDENKDKGLQDFPATEKFIKLVEKQAIEYTQGKHFWEQLQDLLRDSLKKVVENENTLDSLLSPQIREHILPQTRELIENQLIILFTNLEKTLNETIFKKDIIPFDYYKDKSLNYYINPTQKEGLKEKISHVLRNKLIDNEIKQVVFKFIDNRLSEELKPDKRISELFGGNLTKIIQENIDNVVDNLVKFGLEWLIQNKEDLADLVYEKAYQESKAAILYKEPIKDTVKELAEQGIPFFFKKESDSLKELVADGVHQIGESPMAQLKLNIDNEYLKKIVEDFLKREEILDAIQRLLDMLIEEIFKLPLSVFLKILSINEVADLKRILHGELAGLSSHLSAKGLKKTKEISVIASTLLISIIEKHLKQIEIKSVFENNTENDFQVLAENWTKLILEGKEIQQFKNDFILDFLTKIKEKKFEQILNPEFLKVDIRLLINALISKEETRIFFTHQFSSLIATNLEGLVENIAPKTKDFIINQLTEAALKSLENNLDALLGGIDLKKIVESEVSNMQPKEIEDLFYSFADKYFTQLINYGFGFGIIFGLLVDFILMFAIQLFSE
jgi:uncharacterized membrane protein YheB (UPF0754 family)